MCDRVVCFCGVWVGGLCEVLGGYLSMVGEVHVTGVVYMYLWDLEGLCMSRRCMWGFCLYVCTVGCV